tara:strand:- start:322 stop:603 length:282 start_codon:yes stop_codon:yes gene_type:complete
MAGPLIPMALRQLVKSKKFRAAAAGGLGALTGYFATKKAPAKAKAKPAVKRSMRFNKQVSSTTEKKPTGAMAAYQKRMAAGQRKSNLSRKPRK